MSDQSVRSGFVDPELIVGELDVLRARPFALRTLKGLKRVKDGPLHSLAASPRPRSLTSHHATNTTRRDETRRDENPDLPRGVKSVIAVRHNIIVRPVIGVIWH